MRLGSKRTMCGAAGLTLVWLLGVAVSGQAPEPAPLMAEQVFKNVQVLKGISVNDFMGTMGVFSASLGMSCEDCHDADDRAWANFAVDNNRKRTARRMVVMMAEINKTHFGGRQVVTCYSCHRGADRPRTSVDLTVLYGDPVDNPSHVIGQAPLAPPADQVLDKYIEALGGAQRLASLTSFVATGKSVGYGPESAEDRPVEIYARAPNQLTTIIHTGNGDNTTTIDGRNVWLAAPLRPVAVLALDGQDLEAARLDAVLAFPGQIKQALKNWRVGLPTTIGDREAQVVQGTGPGGFIASLHFDSETGLLLRQTRWVSSPVGPLTTQVDYEDYRDVAGVKMPFRRTLTWLDGRENFEITQIRPNVAVDAARFARPAPAKAPAPRNP